MSINYDDIRPHNDAELPSAISRLTKEPSIQVLMEQFFPEVPYSLFSQQLRQIKTIKEFQSSVIAQIVKSILDGTSEGLSYSGLENLPEKSGYLFISNHRDIVLDSALINYILNKEGSETAQIAIGINLLSKPWITDLVKANKSFIVKRDLPRNEMYEASMQLSSYIHETLTSDKESIWIAQREGRSKDGNDKTQGGLINMLGMSNKGDFTAHYQTLNIVPVAISYELDPCDVLKLPELYAIANNQPYQKSANEDYNSMKSGIMGKNGKIHISFGQPILDLPEITKEFSKSNLISHLVDRIDEQIYQNYYLWPSNYIASDLLNGSSKYAEHYTEAQKLGFEERVNKATIGGNGQSAMLRELFLKIYANPLFNKLTN